MAALTDQAIAEIKNLIMSGEFVAGSRLPKEQDLARRLGLSRNSLREAVRALTLIGVLEPRVGDGTYVTSLEPELLLTGMGFISDLLTGSTLLELHQVRRILEPVATELAATRLEEADFAALERCLADMDAAETTQAFIAVDEEFHRIIVMASGNSTLASLIQNLSGGTLRARLWRSVMERDAIEVTKRRHWDIYNALRDRDPKRAAAADLIHLSEGEQWLRQLMQAEDALTVLATGPAGTVGLSRESRRRRGDRGRGVRRDTSSAARVDRAGADPHRARDVGDRRSVALRLGARRRRGINRHDPARGRFGCQLGRHRADLRARPRRGGRRARARGLRGRRGRLRRHEVRPQERADGSIVSDLRPDVDPVGVRAEPAPPGRGAARPPADPLARPRQRNAARGVVGRRLPPSSTRARFAGWGVELRRRTARPLRADPARRLAPASALDSAAGRASHDDPLGRRAPHGVVGVLADGFGAAHGNVRSRSVGEPAAGRRPARRRASSASRSSRGTWHWSSGSEGLRETSESASADLAVAWALAQDRRYGRDRRCATATADRGAGSGRPL